MTTAMWDLALGPFAALFLSLLILYATFRLGIVVPGSFYEASEKRNAMLEVEAKELNGLIRTQTEALTDSRVQNAELAGEVKRLTGEVERLSGETQKLTEEIQTLRYRKNREA